MKMPLSAEDPVPLTSIGIAMIFGPIVVVTVSLLVHLLMSGRSNLVCKALADEQPQKADHCSVSFVFFLCWKLTLLGLVLLYCFVCEKMGLPSTNKFYDRDHFLFMVSIVLGVAVFSSRESSYTSPAQTSRGSGQCTPSAILNRDQTEEWKGWMQVVVLFYSYYGSDEFQPLYHAIVSSYVWLSCFGHCYYFCATKDFSFMRVARILWRQNFLAVALSLTLGHTLSQYGAVMMHNFCFILVYGLVWLSKGINSTKYGLRSKLSVLSLVAIAASYWSSLFDSSSPIKWGNEIRTYLIWQPLLGMAFALNFPSTSFVWRKLEEQRLGMGFRGKVALGSFLVLSPVVFAMKVHHSVTNRDWTTLFSISLIVGFIFFRNVLPQINTTHSPILRNFGRITMETYLLHHHIWLTSGSKRVLVLVPGYPKMNLLLGGMFFLFAANHVQSTTRLIYGVSMAKTETLTWKMLLTASFLLATATKMVYSLRKSAISILSAVALWSIVSGGAFVRKLLLSTNEQAVSSQPGRRVVLCLFLLLVAAGSLTFQSASSSLRPKNPTLSVCRHAVLDGNWINANICDETLTGFNRRKGVSSIGTCNTFVWGWNGTTDSSSCNLSPRHAQDLLQSLADRNITFAGDSIVRHIYHASCRLLGDAKAGAYNTSAEKHSDYSRIYQNTAMEFRWAPFVTNITAVLSDILGEERKEYPDLVVVGGGAWDRLHLYNTKEEQALLLNLVTALKDKIESVARSRPVVWVSPTTMNSWALNTEQKRLNIREDQMADFRDLYRRAGVHDAATFTLDGTAFTSSRAEESYDGVHYPFPIYDGGAQILANSFDWLVEPQNDSRIGFTENDESSFDPFALVILLGILVSATWFSDSFGGFLHATSLLTQLYIVPSSLNLEAALWNTRNGGSERSEWNENTKSSENEDETI